MRRAWIGMLAVVGCGDSGGFVDAAPPDAPRAADARGADAPVGDAAAADGGDPDGASGPDAATIDGGATDAGAIDAGAIDAGAIDAGVIDAQPVLVTPVACPATPDLTVTANGGSFVFTPDDGGAADVVTLHVGAVVRFVIALPHDAVSGVVPNQDGQFYAPGDDELCLELVAAGTLPFFCTLHFFDATIVIAP